jgi:tetratricopeptide (TPR) repeat protein
MLVKSHTHLGHAYLDYKCLDQSYDHLRMGLERNRDYSQTEEGLKYQLYILKLLARVCLDSHRFKESNDYLKEAEEICLDNEEEFGRFGKDYAIVKEFKGDYYVRVEEYDEAVKCYEEVNEKRKIKINF